MNKKTKQGGSTPGALKGFDSFGQDIELGRAFKKDAPETGAMALYALELCNTGQLNRMRALLAGAGYNDSILARLGWGERERHLCSLEKDMFAKRADRDRAKAVFEEAEARYQKARESYDRVRAEVEGGQA